MTERFFGFAKECNFWPRSLERINCCFCSWTFTALLEEQHVQEISGNQSKSMQCIHEIGRIFSSGYLYLLLFDISKTTALIGVRKDGVCLHLHGQVSRQPKRSRSDILTQGSSILLCFRFSIGNFYHIFKYVYSLKNIFPYNKLASRSWTKLCQSCSY